MQINIYRHGFVAYNSWVGSDRAHPFPVRRQCKNIALSAFQSMSRRGSRSRPGCLNHSKPVSTTPRMGEVFYLPPVLDQDGVRHNLLCHPPPLAGQLLVAKQILITTALCVTRKILNHVPQEAAEPELLDVHRVRWEGVDGDDVPIRINRGKGDTGIRAVNGTVVIVHAQTRPLSNVC